MKMADPEKFVKGLKKNGVRFFVGVPDSFLNTFCTYIQNNIDETHHVIAANEGNAVAIAAGYHISTGTIPLVYMQNSGLGNAVNPLVSLMDKNVYAIPAVLMIGWRGEPETADHDQHKTQGEITLRLLEDMRIPYKIMDEKSLEKDCAAWAVNTAREQNQVTALVVKKGVFSGKKEHIKNDRDSMNRERAIRTVLEYMPENTIYVATTGRATRELCALRKERNENQKNDFLNVGAMGHATSIAAGIALGNPGHRIVCLDGDAAAIMHMGAFAAIPKTVVPNLLHIILNNGVHESVGSQPSAGRAINFTDIARSCGYQTIRKPVENQDDLILTMKKLENSDRAAFIDVWIQPGTRDDLGPITESLKQYVNVLKKELQKNE